VTYVDRALAYARAVVAGEILACRWVRLACARQLRDLEEFADHPRFVWSDAHANHVCEFLERLPHVKGPKAVDAKLADAGEGLIRLEPWQCFILTTAFGWRKKAGGRRFRFVYIEVPRGNGKSCLSSGVALYCLSMDGEQGAEVLSAATTREQAKIVWGVAFDMLRKRPAFAARMGLKTPKSQQTSGPIIHADSFSKFIPLSREASNLDGHNPHFVCIDELHAHQTRDVWDVIVSATTKRPGVLVWSITTAGDDEAGICSEVRAYVIKTLTGEVEADEQFGIIYTLDDDDLKNWADPAVWPKANPNWGISVDVEAFAADARKAQVMKSAQFVFKTKYLNLWLNSSVAWMDMHAWDKCGDPTLKVEDFKDCPVWLGLDLATKTDVACKARLFARKGPATEWSRMCDRHRTAAVKGCKTCYPTVRHYYLFLDHFLPERAIEDGRNASYSGWEIEGWLTKTPGDVLDFATVRESILGDQKELEVREVAYDPWAATQIAQELDAAGVTVVEIRNNVAHLSEPMKELEALVLQGRLHHNADPVLRWMMSNVVCIYDNKGNVYPRKDPKQPGKKIDGVVASIMALNRGMADADPFSFGLKFL
jgi:phage terminase large subunit-like protein